MLRNRNVQSLPELSTIFCFKPKGDLLLELFNSSQDAQLCTELGDERLL